MFSEIIAIDRVESTTFVFCRIARVGNPLFALLFVVVILLMPFVCFLLVNSRSQSFTLSGNSNNVVQAMVGSTGTANFCQADYLIIPMASNVGRPATGPSANVDRICGGVLSADVTATSTPIRSELFTIDL